MSLVHQKLTVGRTNLDYRRDGSWRRKPKPAGACAKDRHEEQDAPLREDMGDALR